MKHAPRHRGLVLLVLLYSVLTGFAWPGRVARLTQQLRSEDVTQRREAARLLGEHTAADAREALLVALDDEDWDVRLEAIRSAARVGLRDHVPVLIDWLNDPVADARVAAAEALGVLREARAEATLIRALGDNDAKVRTAAAVALGNLGSAKAVTPLLGRLNDADPVVRLAAVRALGALQDPQVIVPLVSRTQDPDPEVKIAALGVLGSLRDPRALAPLVRSLDDESEDVRLAALAAIGNLRQEAAIQPLRARLSEANGRIGRATLAALGTIGTDRAIEIIVEQLGTPELSRGAVDVLVERVRRVRKLAPESASAVIDHLTRALTGETESSRAAMVGEALIGCSRLVSIESALPVLLDAFEHRRGPLPIVALALASTGNPQVLVPLLQRLDGAQPDDRAALLRALDLLKMKIPADGRAADPLLAELAHAQPETLALVTRLLGRSGAPRTLPALNELLHHTRIDVQLAAVEAVGRIGQAESVRALVPLISDQRQRMRDAATVALGRTLDAPRALELLRELDGLTDATRTALLTSVTYALERLHDQGLNAADQGALVSTLSALLANEDETLMALAVDGLSALKAPEGAAAIAKLLRSPRAARRIHAASALGAFDDPKVRQLLRFVMAHDQTEVAAAAAIALGSIGEGVDAANLAKLAKRLHWPFPGAASYAIAVLARRGLMRPLASRSMLCELGTSREPVVRANVAVAMAQLGLGACDNGVDPLLWLRAVHAPLVRSAAARWVYAAVQAGRMDRVKGIASLKECAERDAEPRVAEACAAPDMPALQSSIHDVVLEPDGRDRLRHRLLAVELADGSVFVGHTDHNGHLRVLTTPAAAGADAFVTDAGLLPLEPAVPSPGATPNSGASSHLEVPAQAQP